MAVFVAGVFLLCCYSGSCYSSKSHGQIPFGDPVLEWQALSQALAMEKALSVQPRASSPSRYLPTFHRVLAAFDRKDLVVPSLGARVLPNALRDILLPTPPPSTTKSSEPQMFESLCHLDRIYVRVNRTLFHTKTAWRRLLLGACVVNRASTYHYYFLYLLTSPCGFSNESKTDFFAINNVLHFNSGPDSVFWELPFDVRVQCHYHRVHHVYSAGIHPQLKGGTVYKKLTSATSATIVLQDAAGNVLTGLQTYLLGQPMYFEAKLIDTQAGANQRLYVNKCYVTASQDSSSSIKHVVIDNQGCMLDSKTTILAKFLTQTSKMSLRFSLGAMLFKDMMASPGTPKKIYLHCEISPGPMVAQADAKSCVYDSPAQKWRELYDDDLVCICCDTFCAPQPRAPKLMVTSSAVEVDYSPVPDNMNLLSGNAETQEFLGYSGEDD